MVNFFAKPDHFGCASQVEWQTGLRLPVARYLAIQTARWHWTPLHEAVPGQSGAVDLGSLILDIRKYWNQNRNTRSKDVQNRNMMKYKFHTSQIPAMLSQFPFAAAHEFLCFPLEGCPFLCIVL
jgi:hypothetical protein